MGLTGSSFLAAQLSSATADIKYLRAGLRAIKLLAESQPDQEIALRDIRRLAESTLNGP